MKIRAIPDIYERTGRESPNLLLTANRVYSVVSIESECYRIINDRLEPCLYPKELFEVVDPSYPCSWVKTEYDEGEYYIEPFEFSAVGFFEDYFDGDSRAIEIYNNYLKSNGLSGSLK